MPRSIVGRGLAVERWQFHVWLRWYWRDPQPEFTFEFKIGRPKRYVPWVDDELEPDLSPSLPERGSE